MTDHLPECGVTRYPICICDRLRACEQRVLERVREEISWVQDLDEALDIIMVALREWPEPPAVPPSVGVPTTPMWPLRGKP